MRKYLEYTKDILSVLAEFGDNIKRARLRRRMSEQMVADACGLSRATYIEIEKGSPTVRLGNYAVVLSVLGGHHYEFRALCKCDDGGFVEQTMEHVTSRRAPWHSGKKAHIAREALSLFDKEETSQDQQTPEEEIDI